MCTTLRRMLPPKRSVYANPSHPCRLYSHGSPWNRRDHTLLQTEKLRERELKELTKLPSEFLSKQELEFVVQISGPVLLTTNKSPPRQARRNISPVLQVRKRAQSGKGRTQTQVFWQQSEFILFPPGYN